MRVKDFEDFYRNDTYAVLSAANHWRIQYPIYSSVRSVFVPKECTSLDDRFFTSCWDLSRVTFEAGSCLTYIGDMAFHQCRNLRELEIPASVEEIGEKCFYKSSLHRISFASGSVLRLIGNEAFSRCTALREIELPPTVEELGVGCFRRSGIYRITFARGAVIKRFGQEAFYGCMNLREIEIPATVVDLGIECFGMSIMYPTGLRCITFASGSVMQRISSDAFACLYTIERIQIPASVEVIESDAFHCGIFGGSALSYVTFETGSRLRCVKSRAFTACEQLQEIHFPASLEEIGEQCFGFQWNTYGRYLCCSALSRVTFASGSRLRKIGCEAFAYCSMLKEIELPGSVQEIGPGAFFASGLQSLRFLGDSKFTVIGPFVVRVEDACIVSVFRSLDNYVIPAEVEVIEKQCFRPADNVVPSGYLSSITFENGSHLKRIASSAFSGCENLKEIEIPESVEEIGQNCFAPVFNLSSNISRITFAKGSRLRKIDNAAFAGCQNITEIEIPAGVEEISSLCFSMYMGSRCPLSRIVFASGSCVNTIGRYAFFETSLKEIEIPESVEVIEEEAFCGCVSLCSVTFASGSRLRYIARKAFWECPKLHEIKVPAGVQLEDNIGVPVKYEHPSLMISFP